MELRESLGSVTRCVNPFCSRDFTESEIVALVTLNSLAIKATFRWLGEGWYLMNSSNCNWVALSPWPLAAVCNNIQNISDSFSSEATILLLIFSKWCAGLKDDIVDKV